MNNRFLTTVIGQSVSFLSWHFFKILCKGEINNMQQLEELKGASFIFAPNHTSHLDWLVLHGLFHKRLKREISFLAKKELFESRFWKHIAIFGKAIRLDRENVTKDVMKNIYSAIGKGYVIGIFPEGTRSADGKLLKGKNGVAKLALLTKLPIVPVGMTGFYGVLPKKQKFPAPCKCAINIGRPIYLKRDHSHKSLDEMTAMVMEEIAKLSGQTYDHSHDGTDAAALESHA